MRRMDVGPSRSVIPDDQKVIRQALGLPDPKFYVDRQHSPHLRCGICQEVFEVGERTVYLDDERVHPDCEAAA